MAFHNVHPRPRQLRDYAADVDPAVIAGLRRMAEPLAGLRVLHLSTGPFGSAVADLLASLVPLQRDLGILADWRVVRGEDSRIWNALYQSLNGLGRRWGRSERENWQAEGAALASHVIDRPYDVVVAHDPQLVALAGGRLQRAHRPDWVWHCHLDTHGAHPNVWADLTSALVPFQAVLFPGHDLVRQEIAVPRRLVVQPAIDPLAPRNDRLSESAVASIVRRIGLDPERPIVGQFAPIDQRYAPLAALGAYWLARQQIPDLQIVLVDRTLAPIDPARRDLKRVLDAAEEDRNVHIIQGETGIDVTELNALQRSLLAVLQMAVPRGFGWGIAEAQWKRRPALVGPHGQLPEQVDQGAAGFVVESAVDAADAIVRLRNDPARAAAIGALGHDLVRRRYLITRLAGDYLNLFYRLVGGETAPLAELAVDGVLDASPADASRAPGFGAGLLTTTLPGEDILPPRATTAR